MEKKNQELKSRNQRRKEFNPQKWASKWLKTNPFDSRVYGGIGESKPVKVMSNEDRRKLGIDQDPELPDYMEEKMKQ